jgi:hypothetical protein
LVRLRVRQLCVLAREGERQDHSTVDCPERGGTAPVEECRRCIRLFAESPQTIECAPAEAEVPRAASASELARRCETIHESAALADAVGEMVRTRARALPVIDARGAVVALIRDVDALRWVARRTSR